MTLNLQLYSIFYPQCSRSYSSVKKFHAIPIYFTFLSQKNSIHHLEKTV